MKNYADSDGRLRVEVIIGSGEQPRHVIIDADPKDAAFYVQDLANDILKMDPVAE